MPTEPASVGPAPELPGPAFDRSMSGPAGYPISHEPPPTHDGMTLAVVVGVGREVAITVRGDVDLASAGRLERAVAGCLDGLRPARLTLDLSGVGFFSAAGVSVLLRLRERARAGLTTLRVVPSTAVRRPLRLLELDAILEPG